MFYVLRYALYVMRKIAQIQFAPWDKIYLFDPNNIILVKNDYVIVKTELGMEMGKVIGFYDVDDNSELKDIKKNQINEQKQNRTDEDNTKIIKPIIRKATSLDLKKIPTLTEKNKILEDCKKIIAKYELLIKLVDVYFSFDNSKLTFAFIAEGRVDFRELVKDLTSHFNRVIRLHQIGRRDEAMLIGDYGPCGRILCCKKSLGHFSSITSSMAELQQIAHRGSGRTSGMCGRLMCCLDYENEGYKKLAEKLPVIGTEINIKGKHGTVVGHHVLMQTVDVKFLGDKTTTQVEIKDIESF